MYCKDPIINKAIKQDIIETIYGLDYGMSNQMIESELDALIIAHSALPKAFNSSKAEMLNIVKTSSEAANSLFLSTIKT